MTQPHTSVKEETLTRPLLRRNLLQLRRETAADLRSKWDLAIMAKVLQVISTSQPRCLGVYWPIQAEPDLLGCYQHLHENGIALALPLVVSKNQALRFVPWAPGASMEKDDYGIPIPQDRTNTVFPDTMLIPCVGFNAQGYRLGYGGGFYDRTLAERPDVKAIGIAYQQAQIDFEPASYDMPLQMVLTEE